MAATNSSRSGTAARNSGLPSRLSTGRFHSLRNAQPNISLSNSSSPGEPFSISVACSKVCGFTGGIGSSVAWCQACANATKCVSTTAYWPQTGSASAAAPGAPFSTSAPASVATPAALPLGSRPMTPPSAAIACSSSCGPACWAAWNTLRMPFPSRSASS